MDIKPLLRPIISRKKKKNTLTFDSNFVGHDTAHWLKDVSAGKIDIGVDFYQSLTKYLDGSNYSNLTRNGSSMFYSTSRSVWYIWTSKPISR